MIFSFLGYIFHPFFYSYHLIDLIIRNPYLTNVLKAIYRPRYELFNTLMFLFCIEYYFSLISYIYLWEEFGKNECTSLATCFAIIID